MRASIDGLQPSRSRFVKVCFRRLKAPVAKSRRMGERRPTSSRTKNMDAAGNVTDVMVRNRSSSALGS